jgi:hypothetical protein
MQVDAFRHVSPPSADLKNPAYSTPIYNLTSSVGSTASDCCVRCGKECGLQSKVGCLVGEDIGVAGCLVDTGVGVADRTVATGVGVAGLVRSLAGSGDGDGGSRY